MICSFDIWRNACWRGVAFLELDLQGVPTSDTCGKTVALNGGSNVAGGGRFHGILPPCGKSLGDQGEQCLEWIGRNPGIQPPLATYLRQMPHTLICQSAQDSPPSLTEPSSPGFGYLHDRMCHGLEIWYTCRRQVPTSEVTLVMMPLLVPKFSNKWTIFVISPQP